MLSGRLKKLFQNSVIFSVGTLSTKAISFFMIPIYTTYLTKSNYGISDLIFTTASLLFPIVTLSIFDAVFRFSFDSSIEKDKILSAGIVVSTLCLFIVSIICGLAEYYGLKNSYWLLFILWTSAFSGLFNYYARGIGFVKLFVFANIISSVLVSFFNIIFLVFMNLQVEGYLISIILANIISFFFVGIIIFSRTKFVFKLPSKSLVKELLKFSIPLIPNALSWWATNDLCRFIIYFYIGSTGNALYAVASKFPSILNTLFSVFNQAWQISAIEEFDSKNKNQYFSSVFAGLVMFSFVVIDAFLFILQPLIYLLSGSAYYETWKFVPFLMLGLIFSNFSGFLGVNNVAAKKTNLLFKTTVYGVILNALISICLIPLVGINGAGIGSFIGFLIVMIVRWKESSKYIQIKINWLNISLNIVVFLIMYGFLFIDNNFLKYVLLSIVYIFLLLQYKKELAYIKRIIAKKV